METRITGDKTEIYRFLSKTPETQLYTIGDLDDFFWPNTVWYALYDKGEIQSVALLYKGMSPPTLLLFYDKEPDLPRHLLKSILPLLPEKLYVHLSPGLTDIFGKENILKHFGTNNRMILREEPQEVYNINIRRLDSGDLDRIVSFYSLAYPDNWFDPRMLETGKYFGYFERDLLAGVAGIHVYSPEYRIAALGNIATLPDFRGRKIAFLLTSALCSDLRKTTDLIGLNVKSENQAAIRCYQNIGFVINSKYDECLMANPEKL
jgi:ribosomal protein S18 acetylase RimI-like enzyme